MIDAVAVADERIGDAAKFQQPIPISVVPGEARDFQSENDPHMGQGNFTGQAREPGSFVGAGAGQPEVFVDNDHLLFGPTELTGIRDCVRLGRVWTGGCKHRRRAGYARV